MLNAGKYKVVLYKDSLNSLSFLFALWIFYQKKIEQFHGPTMTSLVQPFNQATDCLIQEFIAMADLLF